MTKKRYNGYILDIFENNVEAIKSTERMCNNMSINFAMLDFALRQYIDKKIKERSE